MKSIAYSILASTALVVGVLSPLFADRLFALVIFVSFGIATITEKR